MHHRLWRIVVVPVLVLLVGAVFLALLPATGSGAALAQGGTGVVRVATTGTDGTGCGSEGTPCRTVQYAVHEAAEGDEVRIAAGTYTGTQQVSAIGAGQVTTMTQVVIVTKSLTLRGGYTTGDWSTSAPALNETIIDAEGYGRAVTIIGVGAQTVTIEGLTITGGDYTGLGNSYAPGQCNTTNGDCGGGIYAYWATVVVRKAIITGNVASESSSSSGGGGIYLRKSTPGSRIENTDFVNNRSFGTNSSGGGITVRDGSDLTISECRFHGNSAADTGGGLDSQVRTGGLTAVEESEFISNSVATDANGDGGAVNVRAGRALIRGNTFISNTGRHGGALNTDPGSDQQIIVDRNVFIGNSVSAYGGAMYLDVGSVATVTNNILAWNSSSTLADGIMVGGWIHCVLSHNTIVGEPSGTNGEAVYVTVAGTSAELWNNIIVSHTYGVRSNNDVTVTADHTLFYGNVQDAYQGGGILSSTNEITGHAPGFVDPAAFDYHVISGSLAVDAGVDVGVKQDIDGDLRPFGGGYDIGADEVWTVELSWFAYLPLVLR